MICYIYSCLIEYNLIVETNELKDLILKSFSNSKIPLVKGVLNSLEDLPIENVKLLFEEKIINVFKYLLKITISTE